jgi:hypothetical protein
MEVCMFFRYLVCLLALLLLIHTSAPAQTPEAQEPTKNEQQEARKALEQKALTLLDEVVADAQLLKTAINRLRIQIIAADLIWPRDEARARTLFEKSIKDFSELVGSIDTTDQYFYNHIQAPTQLYNELLQTLEQHDPEMALDFVRQTHLPQPPQATSRFANPSYELQVESQIASQIAGKNPKLALQISMESLSKGFSPNIVNVLSQLQDKDREGAAKLANALVKKLLTENLLLNNEAAGVAINLLTMTRRMEAHAPVSTGKTPAPVNSAPLIDAQAYRDLLDLTINAALNSSTAANPSDWRERNIAQTLLLGLQALMPDVERLVPSRAPALERKLADLRNSFDSGTRFWQDNQDVLQKGSLDDILGLAAKAAPELRDQLYQQAAWKALSQGDSERARQIINDSIMNPVERRRMLEEVERNAAMKAASEGKLEMARLGIARLRTNEDRAMALTQLASTVSSKGDKKTALLLLEEARALLGNRAENFAQLQAQLLIARSLATLEPARSFEMLEAMVGQLNELLSAAEVLNGFEQQYFNDGEISWQGTNLSNLVFQVINDLGQLAPADFDRVKNIVMRFQRPEVRLMAQMFMAKAVLSDQSQSNLPISGRRFSFGGLTPSSRPVVIIKQ